jgi:hypothetical protein
VEEAMIKAITGFVGGWRSIAVAAGLAVTVGFGIGWKANGWRLNGKHWKAERDSVAAQLQSATESARIAREGKAAVLEINATLRSSLATYSQNNAALSQANTALATSRAPRIETIYREAERFANDTFDPGTCPREPVDERLLDYIWPDFAGTASAAPVRLAGPVGPT